MAKITQSDAKSPTTESFGRTMRETIESVVIAFVLAFLFRTFEAEAFVIPTGSMAPTLQGRHKEVQCEMCGHWYKASASSESDEGAQPKNPADVLQVLQVTCPMCRYTMDVGPGGPNAKENPSYNGDRILVGKFPYEFADPERWDVIVFKYPGDAKINYIKRLIGLPNETIRIYHGDIYVKPTGEDGAFHIQRKPPHKLEAMLQPVYDNDRVVDQMTDNLWPVRWQPWPAGKQKQSTWTTNDGSRSYEIDGAAPGEQWIRYQHFVPSQRDWKQLDKGRLPAGYPTKPQLITDFYAYNAFVTNRRDAQANGLHWVPDLALECDLEIQGETGSVMLDLVRGGRHFRCTFDAATGTAQLSIDGFAAFQPKAKTAVRGPGKHTVKFANCDDELVLWVDGKAIEFDARATYDATTLGIDRPVATARDRGDLAPAGIGSDGAAVKASHIRIWRDVYYIADKSEKWERVPKPISDYGDQSNLPRESLPEFFSNPAAWAPRGAVSLFDLRREVTFELHEDQFFPLGDNSPASLDGRLWSHPTEHWVDRDLLIGKAFYIYWPHSWPTKYGVTLRLFGLELDIPFVPYFGRMGFVR